MPELEWHDVVGLIEDWVVKSAEPAAQLRNGSANVFTMGDVGYYWNPVEARPGVLGRLTDDWDIDLAKSAAESSTGVPCQVLTLDDLDGPWVKAAYSPTLRRMGEYLNFFPGKYPGGIPNAPSPLAATLSGGLLGAGLGYGVGYLGERFLPEELQSGRLKNVLGVLGGAMGAMPGAAWGATSLARGQSLLDGSDLGGKTEYAEIMDKTAAIELGSLYRNACERWCKQAFETFAEPVDAGMDPLAVNVNRLGQTLWDVGAQPATTAMTMGAMYAAQQIPDQAGTPGYVTPHQTGMLGMMMGAAGGGLAGYAAGALAGKALGILTGMPSTTQNTLKRTGAALGIINAVVPRLFR
jgi:hypothetical protein